MTKQKIIANRYILQGKLGEGGMGTVYRALDRLTNQPIALKQVAFTLDDSLESYSFRMALAQEFQLLASLRHPNIISVLDYGFHEHYRPFFTMQLLESPKTLLQAAQGQPRQVILNLLIQTLQALTYVHQRGLVHRDLKPSNILVDQQGRVQLLDFGLATSHQEVGEQVGTLSYMAPEIFGGKPATPASDLYAVGVLAYEAFTGVHPFKADRVDQMIENIIIQEPDLTPFKQMLQASLAKVAPAPTNDAMLATIQLPTGELHRERLRQTQTFQSSLDPMGAIIYRLLAKKPKERYPNAHQVLNILYEVLGQPSAIQSSDIRESFLQSAQLVGRDEEVVHFSQELFSAVAGQGGAWLIGGESGIGKSRLLDEIATIAQISDVMVLRGQAAAGQGLFELWSPLLRRLLLTTDVSDEEAGLLKIILSDVEALLDRRIADIPQVESQAQQQQLIEVILGLFKRQTTPILLVLEDLQWAHPDMTLIHLLSEAAFQLPLLMLASYRDDERPALPEKLPLMQRIKLDRLNGEAIQALSRSMLGEAGTRKEVLTLLQEETEGNVFFLIEIVRVLAEEAGNLANIGIKTLRHQVLTEGIQGIVRKRLSHVPAYCQPMLRLAAVLGRDIQLEVLTQADSDLNYDLWAVECQNAAVIVWQDGRWRFSHEKLREGILLELSQEEVRRLHGIAAWALEEAYPNNLQYSLRVMEHWHKAQQIEKEAEYALKAAQFALQQSNLEQAREYFERASITMPDQPARLYTLQIGASETYLLLGYYDLAARAAQRALIYAKALEEGELQAFCYTQLALVAMQRGNLSMAEECLEQAAGITVNGNEDPIHLFAKGNLAWLNGQAEQAKLQLDQSLSLAHKQERSIWVMQVLSTLGNMAEVQNDLITAQAFYESNLDLAREINNRAHESAALKDLGVVHHRRGDLTKAAAYFQSAVSISQVIHYRRVQGLALLHLSRIELAQGQAGQGQQNLHTALNLLLNLGAIPSLLVGGEYAGRWLAEQGQLQTAVDLWCWVYYHPAASDELRQTCRGLVQQYGAELIPPEGDVMKGFDRAIRQVLVQLGKP